MTNILNFIFIIFVQMNLNMVYIEMKYVYFVDY